MNKIVALMSLITLGMSQAQEAKDVTIGNNGWLFFNDELTPAPEANLLSQNYNSISTISNLLKKRGIELDIVLIPYKSDIYEDELPASSRNDLKKANNYDEVMQHFQDMGIRTVDLRPGFRQAARSGQQIFYRTDTHWNHIGADLAAQITANQLALGKVKGPPAQYKKTEYQEFTAGDLNKLLGIANPEKFTALNFERSDNLGLLDEAVPSIALVGTSYSASSIVGKALSAHSGKDILDASTANRGYAIPMTDYLASSAFQLTPPKVIVWEIPNRIVARNFIAPDANDTLQLGANLADPKTCGTLASNVEPADIGKYQARLKWNQFIKVNLSASAPTTLKILSFSKERIIDIDNNAVINIPQALLQDTKLVFNSKIRADLSICPLPDETIRTLMTWKTIDVAANRVNSMAHLEGIYDFIEPGGRRSGYGPKTLVRFWTPQPKDIKLNIDVENYISGQMVSILLNGKVIQSLDFAKSTTNVRSVGVTVKSVAGPNLIEVRYADWNGKTKQYFPQDPRPVGILFTKFQISQ